MKFILTPVDSVQFHSGYIYLFNDKYSVISFKKIHVQGQKLIKTVMGFFNFI